MIIFQNDVIIIRVNRICLIADASNATPENIELVRKDRFQLFNKAQSLAVIFCRHLVARYHADSSGFRGSGQRTKEVIVHGRSMHITLTEAIVPWLSLVIQGLVKVPQVRMTRSYRTELRCKASAVGPERRGFTRYQQTMGSRTIGSDCGRYVVVDDAPKQVRVIWVSGELEPTPMIALHWDLTKKGIVFFFIGGCKKKRWFHSLLAVCCGGKMTGKQGECWPHRGSIGCS